MEEHLQIEFHFRSVLELALYVSRTRLMNGLDGLNQLNPFQASKCRVWASTFCPTITVESRNVLENARGLV